ncbi:hypothetical protein Tco_0263504, partial [Tanacetum coccineum]
MHSELPLREVSFLDQKGPVHMRTSVTRRRNDTMQMSVPPILCFKDFPKISTSSSITTLKQKQFWTTSKYFWLVLNSQKKIENLSCTMILSEVQDASRFVTAVKLNKGLKEKNHEQLYDQRTKTAIGAQNPFHLRQAKKAQPALYDGEELLK